MGSCSKTSTINPIGASEKSPVKMSLSDPASTAEIITSDINNVLAMNYSAMCGIKLEPAQNQLEGTSNVAWIDNSDWMEYKVNVPESGNYLMWFIAASPNNTGSFQLKCGGSVLSTVKIYSTGGWQKWKTFYNEAYLQKGIYTYRIQATGSGWNFYSFGGRVLSAQTQKIQAECYTAKNNVKTEPCSDYNGGLDVGYTSAGSWMSYTTTIPVAGNYSIDFRVASLNGGGKFIIKVDGVVSGDPIEVQNTGGWQNWDFRSDQNFWHMISFTAGSHVIKLESVTGGWNLNWFRIMPL
jgi:endoglucanase